MHHWLEWTYKQSQKIHKHGRTKSTLAVTFTYTKWQTWMLCLASKFSMAQEAHGRYMLTENCTHTTLTKLVLSDWCAICISFHHWKHKKGQIWHGITYTGTGFRNHFSQLLCRIYVNDGSVHASRAQPTHTTSAHWLCACIPPNMYCVTTEQKKCLHAYTYVVLS